MLELVNPPQQQLRVGPPAEASQCVFLCFPSNYPPVAHLDLNLPESVDLFHVVIMNVLGGCLNPALLTIVSWQVR